MATIEEYLKPPVPNSFSENNNSNGEAEQRLLPSDITNLLQGGVASAKAGDKELARNLFFKVISLDQNNESAWLWLASISDQANERFEYLQRVLSINPSNERALSWLKVSKEHIAKTFVQKGADAAKEGDKASAVQYLLQAIDYDSENEIAWMWLASLAGSLEDKLAYLQRILIINPNNEQVSEMFTTTSRKLAGSIAQKGVDAYHAGDNELAAKCLVDVTDYDTTDIEEVWLLKGHLADSLEEKVELFSRVVEINPNNQVAVTSLKATQEQIEEKNTWRCPVCQTKEKKPFEICRVCNSLLTLDDIDFALANDSVNEVLVREGIQNLKRSFKDEITSNDYYKLGLAYLNLKDLKESIAFFQASLRLEPENDSLAVKIEYLTQAFELRKTVQEQIPVPVVTEETLVEEELASQSIETANEELASSHEEVYTDELSQSSAAVSEEAEQLVSEDLSESLVSEALPESNDESLEAADNYQEQNESDDSLNGASLFDSTTVEEETETEESLGWPLPEVNETQVNESETLLAENKVEEPETLFMNDELQKADTSPLELPASLKEQLEKSFGESVSETVEETLSENEEKAYSLATEQDEVHEFESAESSTEESDSFAFPSSVKEVLESLPVEDEPAAEVESIDSSSDAEQENATSFFEEVAASPMIEESANEKESVDVVESFSDRSVDAESSVVELTAGETDAEELSNEQPVAETFFEKESQDHEIVDESAIEPKEEFASSSALEDESSQLSSQVEMISFSKVENENPTLLFEEEASEISDANDDSTVIVSENARELETSDEINEEESLSESLDSSDSHSIENAAEETPSVVVSDSPAPVAQTFVLPNYEIRVTQSHVFNTSVVESPQIGVASQTLQITSEANESSPISTNGHKTIMIVDDSPTVRKLVSMKLGKSGHHVITAVDGIDALAKITEEVPDLILLDVTMPRLDGYQLCKLIKSNETTKHVPIIMLSGKEGLVDKVRGKMAGAATFLTKPFEPETLLKTVNEYCGIQNDN